MPMTYDRYTVSIPGDLADNLEALGDQAITEARERARIFAIPAVWTATRIKGDVGDNEVVFRVVRKRAKRIKTPV